MCTCLLKKILPSLAIFSLLFTSNPLISQDVDITHFEQELSVIEGAERVPMLKKICKKLSYSDPVRSLNFSLEGLELSKKFYPESDYHFYFTLHTGNLFENIDSLEIALPYFFAALPLGKKLGDHLGVAKTHHSISIAKLKTFQPDSAVYHMDLANRHAVNSSDSFFINKTYMDLGAVNEKKNDYESAVFAYMSAYHISVEMKDTNRIVSSLNALGMVQEKLGSWAEALESILLAESICQKCTDENKMKTKLRVGIIFSILGHWEKSLKGYLECLEIAKRTNQPTYIFLATSNISAIYTGDSRPKDFKKSLDYALEAYSYSKNVSGRYKKSGNLVNLGYSYYGLGDTVKAFKWLKMAQTIAIEEGNSKGHSKALLNMGKICLENGQLNRAFSLTVKAHQIAQKANRQSLSVLTSAQMYRCYKALGQTQLALEHLEEQLRLIQGPISQGQMKAIIDILIDNKTQQSEKLLLLETQKTSALEKQAEMAASRQRLIIGAVILVFLMGIFIAVGQRRKIQLKEALLDMERELRIAQNKSSKAILNEKDQRNYRLSKDIEKVSQEVEAKEKLISDMKSQMNQLLQNENIFNRSAYQELTTTILESSKDGWNEFDSDFQHLNPSFFAELKNNHPNLTGNELRLCAFVRLNLSDKEIAQVLNIAPESAKKARQRLKKKLDLDVKADLLTFVMSV